MIISDSVHHKLLQMLNEPFVDLWLVCVAPMGFVSSSNLCLPHFHCSHWLIIISLLRWCLYLYFLLSVFFYICVVLLWHREEKQRRRAPRRLVLIPRFASVSVFGPFGETPGRHVLKEPGASAAASRNFSCKWLISSDSVGWSQSHMSHTKVLSGTRRISAASWLVTRPCFVLLLLFTLWPLTFCSDRPKINHCIHSKNPERSFNKYLSVRLQRGWFYTELW